MSFLAPTAPRSAKAGIYLLIVQKNLIAGEKFPAYL